MKKILGLAAIMSSFAFVACGDDTGTGGATGSTGNASASSTKATSASGNTSASSTQAASGSNTASNNSSASTGGGMNLDVTFDDFGPHDGQLFKAAIVVGADPVQTQEVAMASANFTVNFTDIPAGTHKIRYFADLNGNGVCDPPMADHVWEKDITVDGSPVTITHDLMWSDQCATFPDN